MDTVLDSPDVQPGGYVSGQVRFAGGDHEVEVERIVVALQTRVEVEGSDSEYDATVEFQRQQLTGGFRLGPGQQHAVPFQLPVPWETPITHMYGQRLPGTSAPAMSARLTPLASNALIAAMRSMQSAL